MVKRCAFVLGLAVMALLWPSTVVRADIQQAEENSSADPQSELVLTNGAAQLTDLLLQGYTFPCGIWVWPQTREFQPYTVVWADTGQLPSELAGLTNCATMAVHGVPAWPLWVTLWPASNSVTILRPWSDEVLAEVAVPEEFPAWQVYEENLRVSCILSGINYTNREALVEQGYEQFSVPQVTMNAWLMDLAEQGTYWDNIQSEYEAQNAKAAQAVRGFNPMDDEEGEGQGQGATGDPCSLANLTLPFHVTSITSGTNGATITWPSCQALHYLILSTDVLSTNTQWQLRAWVWGQPNASATSWTDLSATNANIVTQRFYKVQRNISGLMAAGGNHSVALTPDGKLWAWGHNDGNLGDGFSDLTISTYADALMFDRPYPGEVAPASGFGQTISNAVAVAAGGDDFTVVADANGTLWTFGENGAGQLGNGSAIDVYTPSPITGVSNVVSVAAGSQYALALCADGTVFAWGADLNGDGNSRGQLGVGDLGVDYTSFPTQVLISAQIVAIAAGQDFGMALDVSGYVWTWGNGRWGRLGDGVVGDCDTNYSVTVPAKLTTISNVVAVAAGSDHAMALTADKRVWTWGDNYMGALGRTITNCGGGDSFDPLPGLVTGLSNVVAIAAGEHFCLAVTTNGSVYAWGDNSFGELGTFNFWQVGSGGIDSTNGPMLVSGIGNAVLVSAPTHPLSEDGDDLGGYHCVAMSVDQGTNHYWGWGDTTYGDVGYGPTSGNGTNDTPDLHRQVIFQSTPGTVQFCTLSQRSVQLGTQGSFTAQCNGTLYLYFNDEQGQFGDDDGSFTVTVSNLAANVNVPAYVPYSTVYPGYSVGVPIGTVTNNGVYHYSASGFCVRDNQGNVSDPDGKDRGSNQVACTSINVTNSVCPTLKCFSLVGKIQ